MNHSGEGIPTKQTKGNVGDIYVDTNTGKKYCCTFVITIGGDPEYDWVDTGELAEDLHIPKDEVEAVIFGRLGVKEEFEEKPELLTKNFTVPDEEPSQNQNRNYADYSKKNKQNNKR